MWAKNEGVVFDNWHRMGGIFMIKAVSCQEYFEFLEMGVRDVGMMRCLHFEPDNGQLFAPLNRRIRAE